MRQKLCQALANVLNLDDLDEQVQFTCVLWWKQHETIHVSLARARTALESFCLGIQVELRRGAMNPENWQVGLDPWGTKHLVPTVGSNGSLTACFGMETGRVPFTGPWTSLHVPSIRFPRRPVDSRDAVTQVKSVPAHEGGIASLDWSPSSSPAVLATGCESDLAWLESCGGCRRHMQYPLNSNELLYIICILYRLNA